MNEPQPQPSTHEPDRWYKLVHSTIPAHRKRIAKLADAGDVKPAVLLREMCDTVLAIVGEIGEMGLDLSAGTSGWLDGLTAHVESLDERLEGLEIALGDGTQISAEHAAMLVGYIEASNAIFQQMLDNDANIDTAGRQKLTEHIQLGASCLEVIGESTVTPEDDPDADGADQEDALQEETAPAPA